MCADALAIYHDVTSRGIQAAKPFVGNGLWDLALRDPDGYHVHFESPTDVPEDTVYRRVNSAAGADARAGHEGSLVRLLRGRRRADL